VILRSRNVLAHGAASIHIDGDRIVRIGAYEDTDASVIDYGDLVLMPGIVDSHVHVNEPGRTEWEGFDTATRAAAAGGVTTIVDMPLNSIPPTTTVAALMTKAEAMTGKCRVDVGLWGGAVPGNAGELRDMLAHGALGFKCFLIESGVAEFGHLSARELEEALRTMRGTNAPLLVHAEVELCHPEPAKRGEGPASHMRDGSFGVSAPQDDRRSYRAYLHSRPHEMEDEAIALVARLANSIETPAHIVHLSSANALRMIGGHVTAETTPHYLFFESESIPDGAPQYKCAPPIRDHANREELWRGVKDGVLAGIVSDHSPCTPELKKMREGDVERAWGGIASLQFGLSIIWAEAQRRGVKLEEVSRLMSEGPASIARLDRRKGRLAAGFDADIIAFDPNVPFTITEDIVEHRHKVTPYEGAALRGKVRATFVRGRKVWEDDEHIGDAIGTWLTSAI
jgi:allantoinase